MRSLALLLSAFFTLCSAASAQTLPVFTSSRPGDVTTIEGEGVTLTTLLASGTLPITYQWNKDGSPLAGATTSSLTFYPVRRADAGQYFLQASNVAGTVTTRTATVVVNAATLPVITHPPQPASVYPGQTATFIVGYTSTGTVSYQWFKDGAPLLGYIYAPTLSVGPVTEASAGDYSLRITNFAGEVMSPAAHLTVLPAGVPAITTQPKDVTVAEGESASFSVSVAPTGTVSYQWYFNGEVVRGLGGSSFFSIYPVDVGHAGKYHVVVTGSAGSVKSSEVTLNVLPPPPPAVVELHGPSLAAGGSITLSTGSSTYSGRTTFQWFKDGRILPASTALRFDLTSVTPADAGDYHLLVSNDTASTASFTAHLDVLAPPAGTNSPRLIERAGDTVFFAFATPATLHRFDLASGQWLTPIALPAAPTAMAASTTALYLASGAAITRYNLDGTSPTPFSSPFTSDIAQLEICDDQLLVHRIVNGSSELTPIRLATGVKNSARSYATNKWGELTALPDGSRMYTRGVGVFPARAYLIDVANGLLATADTHSYPFAAGTNFIASPDSTQVAETSGIVFDRLFNFVGSLGGPVDDLAFGSGGRIVALRGEVLSVYDKFLEVGRLATGLSGPRLFLRGNDVFVFGSAPVTGVLPFARLSLANAQPIPVAAAVSPYGLGFTPDKALLDRNGVLLLFSKLHRHLFRWSVAERRFLDSIPLQGVASHVAYSAATDRIYVAYSNSRVTQIRLDEKSLVEQPFFTASGRINSLSTAGESVVFSDSQAGSSERYLYVLAPDGRTTTFTSVSDPGRDIAWAPSTRRLYHFQDWLSPNALKFNTLSTAGVITGNTEWPYHGQAQHPTTYPLCLSPDDTTLLLGSGKVYQAATLQLSTQLANAVDDAAWAGATLFTARNLSSSTELQRWNSAYQLESSHALPGRVFRLFAAPGNRLLVVSFRHGLTALTVLDRDLNELSTDLTGQPNRVANLSCRTAVGSGDQALIAGFVVSGAQPKTMLVRAAGPALTAFSVAGAVADPQLLVRNSSGAVVATNDNWEDATDPAAIGSATTRVGAFPFAPGSRDSALLLTLPAGAYTAEIRSATASAGVALVEVYDTTAETNPATIANISTRAQVSTGDGVLITGISVQGGRPKRFLIRAVGPGLTAFGLKDPLAHPTLQLFRDGQLVALGSPQFLLTDNALQQVAAATTQAGAFPLSPSSLDAVLVAALQPGNYTVVVSGASNGTGVALVEVYDLSP